MFVQRDADGKICAISEIALSGFTPIAPEAPELIEFFNLHQPRYAQQTELFKTDAELARVLEDVIDVLTQKGVFQFTELPEAAQQKLLNRKNIRRDQNSLNLIDDEHNNGFMP